MGDITKYKDKIDPDKEYKIVGQDILDVINTIDSLKNEVNKIDSSYKAHKCINISDTIYVNKYDTIVSHTIQHDTVYVNQTKGIKLENYSFYIIFGLLMCLAIYLTKK